MPQILLKQDSFDLISLDRKRANVSSAIIIDLVNKDIKRTRENVAYMYISSLRKETDITQFNEDDPSIKNGYTHYDPNNIVPHQDFMRRFLSYGTTGQTGVWKCHYIILIPRMINGIYYTQTHDPNKGYELTRTEQFQKSHWKNNSYITLKKDDLDHVFQHDHFEKKGYQPVNPGTNNDMYYGDNPSEIAKEISEWVTGNKNNALPLFSKYARSYQIEFAIKHNKFCDNNLSNNLSNIFYLMAKPRSGKNLSSALSIWKHVRDNNLLNETIYVHWFSLWPSTFNGYREQLSKWQEFAKNFNVVDTSKEDWDINQIKPKMINVLMSSMQSLGVANEKTINYFNKSDDVKVVSISSATAKLKKLQKFPAKFRVVDEADHGMRTTNAKDILKQLSCKFELWMSGSDLYALVNLTNENNSYIYDSITEQKLVNSDPTFNRPRLVVYANKFDEEIFDQIPGDLLIDGMISRRMKVIMETNVKGKRYKKHNDGFWYIRKDKQDIKIAFNNYGVVRKLFEISYGINQTDVRKTPSLLGLNHGYYSLPSVQSMYAFYNMIKEFYSKENIDIKIANECGSASEIELNINNWIAQTKNKNSKNYQKKTILLAVGKMMRGSTVPDWCYVMRFDDSVSWSINIQRDLRSSSGNGVPAIDGRKGTEVYVFDWNPLRRMIATFDLGIQLSSNNGLSSEEMIRELLVAQPIFLQAGNYSKNIEVNYEKLIFEVNKYIDIKTFSSDNMLNKEFEINFDDIMSRLDSVSDHVISNKLIILEGDAYSGKSIGKKINESLTKKIERRKKARKTLETHNRNEILFRDKCKNIISLLPLLIYINNGKQSNLIDIINKATQTDIWCDHVGMDWGTFVTICEENIFNIDYLNARIEMFSVKVRNNDINFNNIKTIISRPKKGDVQTPSKLVNEILTKISFTDSAIEWNYFDLSCGDGEFIYQIQQKLINLGLSINEANQRLYFADSSLLNIEITKRRLTGNIDNNHYFVYNEYIDKMQKRVSLIDAFIKMFLEIFGYMKFDVMVGNPPYTLSGQGSPSLYDKFITETIHIILKKKGTLALITPISWINSETYKQTNQTIFDLGLHSVTFLSYREMNVKIRTLYFVCVGGYNGDIHYYNSNNPQQYTLPRNNQYIPYTPNGDMTKKILEIQTDRKLRFKSPHLLRVKKYQSLNKNHSDMKILISMSLTGNHTYGYISNKENVDLTDTDCYRVVIGYLRRQIVVIIEPNILIPKGFRYIPFSTKERAEKLKDYLNSSLIRYIVKQTYTSRTADNSQFKFVPYIDLSFITITDNEIFKFFHIDGELKKEITTIKNKSPY